MLEQDVDSCQVQNFSRNDEKDMEITASVWRAGKVMPRVCLVGRVGGQADQPGSTRTLSPSVHEGRR
jgi:hypothetical protein